jgi:transcription initiation factor TFIIIB Brf1 subunit/transcription initiation factor TFIIB
MPKEQKGKGGNVESYSHQKRIITDYESGETICSNCGMVVSDRPKGPEWASSLFVPAPF